MKFGKFEIGYLELVIVALVIIYIVDAFPALPCK